MCVYVYNVYTYMDTGIKRRKPKRSPRGQKFSIRRSKGAPLVISRSRSGHRTGHKSRQSMASGKHSLSELQDIAKHRGIPFGGLTKTKLIKKINEYSY